MLIYERMTKPNGLPFSGARLVTAPQAGSGSLIFVLRQGTNGGTMRPLGSGDDAG